MYLSNDVCLSNVDHHVKPVYTRVSQKGERNRTHPNATERTRTQPNATERKRTHPNANERRRMQGSLVDVNDWANTGRVLSFAAIRQVQN